MSDLQVKPGDLIAVYGLLRAGQSGFVKFDLNHAFKFISPCEIHGQMFDMGGFPGLYSGDERVIGDIYQVLDANVIAKLDEFEDFWPQTPEKCRYQRRRTVLAVPNNTEAWVYHCLLPNHRHKNVPDGDWVKYFSNNYAI
ncbi:MAG: gamma-glutamylcyclotransferase [Robiginitomaculum sp.]|nr:gamma-glutamylcyclotransferase [Robiginitomaculum sp.]